MQLYYMQKEGHKVSDSSVVLMTVAVVYKLVLALMGVAILLFYRTQLMGYLGNYIWSLLSWTASEYVLWW
ncbi:MAG: hypothetical protein ACLTTO_07580 [Lachnospiraceae bacterium]